MAETTTFVTKDKNFQFTVKTEFLKIVSNPEEVDLYKLLTEHKIINYFHNPVGPANIRLKDNYVEYWVNGKILSKEEGKVIAHNYKFKNKLNEIVSSGEDDEKTTNGK